MRYNFQFRVFPLGGLKYQVQSAQNYIIHVFTQPLRIEQNTTQGQLSSVVKRDWIQSLPTPSLVA